MTRKSGPSKNREDREIRNEDPLTGEPGAHPVETGVGAAIGGVAGGAIGSVAGPIGAAAGAIAGGVVGGYAGKATGESIDPTVESDYWRQNYPTRPYYSSEYSYEDFEPAYQAGWEMEYAEGDGTSWDEREKTAQIRWREHLNDNQSGMTWEEAREAARDAYERMAEQRRRDRAANKPR